VKRYFVFSVLFYFVGFHLLLPLPVFAEEMDSAMLKTLIKEVNLLKSRVSTLEETVQQQDHTIQTQKQELKTYHNKFEHTDTHISHRGGHESLLEESGVEINAGATLVLQGTGKANGSSLVSEDQDFIDVSYSVDLEIEKSFGDYGSGFIHIETGDGSGIEDELQVFFNVNRDNDDSNNSLSVTEAFYEQTFLPDRGIVTIGKIDPTVYIDSNEYANDETSQFLGAIFRNNPAIEFPANALGFRLGFTASDLFEWQAILQDGDDDGEDIFNTVFTATQLTVSPELFGHKGQYRILGWLNDTPHTQWLAVTDTQENGYGFGISFDQEIFDDIGMFVRYGWQNPEVYLAGSPDFSLEHSWSTGIQLGGNLWHRQEDVVGIAVGQVVPSDDYKKALSTRNGHVESHLETYYNFKMNQHLSISPDIQIIWNPYGDDASTGDDPIVVFGTRAQVDF